MNMQQSRNKIHSEQQVETTSNEAKLIPVPLFILFFLSSSFLGLNSFILNYGGIPYLWLIFGLTVGITLITFISTVCIMSHGKCQLLKLFFLVDNWLVCWVTILMGVIGITELQRQVYPPQIAKQYQAYAIVIQLMGYLEIVETRVLLKYGIWKPWQIITKKIALLVIMALLIKLASAVIFSATIETMKQFIFIYVFGYFSLYFQIYAKLSDVDGTTNLHTHYTPINTSEQTNQVNKFRLKTVSVDNQEYPQPFSQ